MTRAALLAAMLLAACGVSEPGIAGDASAPSCGACHVTEYAAWSGSGLASSGTSPVFAALSASAAQAWGADAQARCVSCHRPGFGGDHGVGCVSCHSATGNLATRDDLLVVDLNTPVSGTFANPIATPAHGSRTYGFLSSPELCATCHEVTGPDLFHETTYDEYQASPAAAVGLSCAACHLPATTPGPAAAGESNSRPLVDHSFVGLDPPWGATGDAAASAVQRTLQLLQSGLSLTMVQDTTGVVVTVQNAAGHAIPTGVAFIRRVWVDVSFTGADGTTADAPAAIDLGAQPTLNGAPVALITEGDAVQSQVLAPGASETVHVDTPTALQPPLRSTATLRATAVRPEVLAELGLSDLAQQVPIHEIAVVTVP